jgi:AmpE protein
VEKERDDNQDTHGPLQTSETSIGAFVNIEDTPALTKGMSRHLLIQASQHIVAILFGFLLFGAFGAMLYRLPLQLKQHCRKLNNSYQGITTLMDDLVGWLNWIPARLSALCYALAGNFVNSFSVLLRHLLDLPPGNEILLVDCGLAALNDSSIVSTATNAPLDEQVVIDLIERVLVIILVSIALMTLGAWIS